MAIGSGLGSQCGFATESSAWATRAAADHFIPFTGWDIQKVSERATSSGIRAGSTQEILGQHVETHEYGVATLECEVQTKTMGLLIQSIMGAAAAPTLIGETGSSYSQTHTLSAISPGDKRSLTIQGGTPLRSGGTAQCKELTGARCISAEFSCEVGGALEAVFEFVGKKYDGSQALATASYTAGTIPFRFKDGTVKTGTYSSEAALEGVRKMSVKFERSIDEPFWFGSAGLMGSEPVLNGFTQITGSLSADYTTATKAALEDRALALTSTSVVWEFVGSTAISGSNYPTFRITLPGTVFESKVAVPDGVQEITVDYDFKSFDDGTNTPSIYIVSADTAL